MNENITSTTTSQNQEVKHLNQLLRGELAAAASYDKALEHVGSAHTRTRLEQNRRSHVDRVVLLAQLVRRGGGTPVSSPGVWGALAKLYERGAALLGEDMLIQALHEGEHAWRDMYEKGGRANIAGDLVDDLIAQQRDTEKRLSELLN